MHVRGLVLLEECLGMGQAPIHKGLNKEGTYIPVVELASVWIIQGPLHPPVSSLDPGQSLRLLVAKLDTAQEIKGSIPKQRRWLRQSTRGTDDTECCS